MVWREELGDDGFTFDVVDFGLAVNLRETATGRDVEIYKLCDVEIYKLCAVEIYKLCDVGVDKSCDVEAN